ncbi:MAG: hypothetical protein Kow0037_30580 [Calditrichia bacterium]
MNSNIFLIMAPALFECLVLVGIHSYLGLHVIRRKVIFVDLALAQIAALGTTVGFLFGILPGTAGAYWFSLTFTFIGAAIFSVSRFRNDKIPQEAIIGLAYAVAAALAILVIDKAPHGAEHIKELLTGSILWVQWGTILKAAIVYSLVGIFHYIFRRQFLLISDNPEEAYRRGMSVRFWDFLFYMSFGVVITHSVGTAGVLLVFVFLVVPAIASMMITDVLWKQLAIGWGLGFFVSVVGLYLSYLADLPSGPAVVAFYAFMLVLIALIRYIRQAGSRAIGQIAIGVAAFLVIITGLYGMGQYFQEENHQHHHHGVITDEEHLLHEVKEHRKLSAMTETELARFLAGITEPARLQELFTAEPEPYIRFKIAGRLAEVEMKEGLLLLMNLLEECRLPFLRSEIITRMREVTGRNFGYDPSKDAEMNKTALSSWRAYISGID